MTNAELMGRKRARNARSLVPAQHPRDHAGMTVYLRKVIHPQAHDNYRVILKRDGDEVEIGSIGIQHGAAWTWGIATVIPMRTQETQGEGKDRSDCMRQFRAAWDRFDADESNLAEFLNVKRGDCA